MLIIFACVFAVAVFFVWFWWNRGGWSAIFIALMFTAIALMIAVPFTVENVEKSSKGSLQAMGNSQGVSGSSSGFLIYSYGSMEDTQIVQYVVKNKGGYSQLKKVDAPRVRIFEDEEKKPYYIRHTTERVIPQWTGFAFLDMDKPKMTHMDFHVPKGSVTQDYSIDVSSK